MSETINEFISIRQMKLEDIHFILNSSISCLSKYTESIVKGMNRLNVHKHIEMIMLYALNRIDYSVFLASHKDDSDSIIAYIIADTNTNHVFFQYTKYAYRNLGIQKTLLLPLVINLDENITVNFPTKEMLRLQKLGRICIENKFLEDLLQPKEQP